MGGTTKKPSVSREYSRECQKEDIPYYPIRLAREQEKLSEYVLLAKEQERVSFVGRLGTYRYLDMDVTIAEALSAAQASLKALAVGENPPVFFVDPL